MKSKLQNNEAYLRGQLKAGFEVFTHGRVVSSIEQLDALFRTSPAKPASAPPVVIPSAAGTALAPPVETGPTEPLAGALTAPASGDLAPAALPPDGGTVTTPPPGPPASTPAAPLPPRAPARRAGNR